METIKLKMMTDLEEKLSALAQPLLEIAEGKRDIDNWNDDLMKLLNEASHQKALSRAEVLEELRIDIATYSGISDEQTRGLLDLLHRLGIE